VVERGPVPGGGTAGTLPSPLNFPYFEYVVEAGDRISWLIDEVAGATPTVNMFAAIDPA